ncbi:MAG: hypothetical protein JW726_09470 [Anaerolineales bacterium]|nr:hypothetical protein [Anaerolineales bacterium]
MRTPAGKECRYFYGDYHRGREREECRLLQGGTSPLPWRRELCETCPVPGIQMANACQSMSLKPRLRRPFPFFKQRVEVTTYCTKTHRSGFDAYIGCGECHTLLPVFGENPHDGSAP